MVAASSAHDRKWFALSALRILALSFGGLHLLVCGAAFAWQRSLIYPKPPPAPLPSRLGEALIIAGANDSVLAWHVPAAEGRPTIVHFHGNGEQLADLEGLGDRLSESGIGLLAVEYPGYGLAPGETTEATIYAAADAALRHAHGALGIAREQIVLQGRSLGTGVATEMAKRGHGAALVLLSPYTSMVEMASLTLPYLPTSLLLRDRFESAAKLEALTIPALAIHGEADALIPLAMAERICTIHRSCELVRLPGEGHDFLLGRELTNRITEFALRHTASGGARTSR